MSIGFSGLTTTGSFGLTTTGYSGLITTGSSGLSTKKNWNYYKRGWKDLKIFLYICEKKQNQ